MLQVVIVKDEEAVAALEQCGANSPLLRKLGNS